MGAAALYGSAGIFTEGLFAEGIPASSIAPLRLVVGTLTLAAVAAVLDRPSLAPGWRGLAWLAGLGGVITAIFQLAEQLSFAAAGVTSTVALLYLSPALVIALSGPALGEWPTRAQIALALLSVAGVWLTVAGGEGVVVRWTLAGVGWGALCGVMYAAYTLFGRVSARRHSALATTLFSTLGGCVLLLVVVPLAFGPLVLPTTTRAWVLLIGYGVLTQAAATGLFYDALRRIDAGRVAITATLEPVVAAVLATILLDQGLRMLGWVGLAMVVGGVAGAYAMEQGESAR
jgi:DME family drug/metabolite transporter